MLTFSLYCDNFVYHKITPKQNFKTLLIVKIDLNIVIKTLVTQK